MTTADANFPLADPQFITGGMLLGQFTQDGEYPLGHAPNGTGGCCRVFEFQLRVELVGAPG
jgi:hypothetical protein